MLESRSRLEPIKRVARMLKRRFENEITFLRHRIVNAGSESLNAKIKWVKHTGCGFGNRQNSSTPSTSTAAAATYTPYPLNSRKRPRSLSQA